MATDSEIQKAVEAALANNDRKRRSRVTFWVVLLGGCALVLGVIWMAEESARKEAEREARLQQMKEESMRRLSNFR